MAGLADLADRIKSVVENPSLLREGDGLARAKLLKVAEALVEALKSPDQIVADMAFHQYHFMSVRLALDMGIFESLAATESPLSVAELAKPVGADPQLVLRIARSLVGTGFLADGQTVSGQNGFLITKTGQQAIVPSAKAGLKYHFDQQMDVVRHAPTFFRGNGYQTPKTQSEGFFQHVYDTGDDCYTYFSRQPGVMENFNTFMQGYFGSREMIAPLLWFRCDEVCLDGFDPDRGFEYVYVDVGGGRGHHVQELVEKYPNVRGKFLLQDRASVIEDVEKTPGVALLPQIETMAYDFFDVQPVWGARTYALDNVLHNWNDDLCQKILARVKDAMVPGYSKLVVQGIVMPAPGVPLLQSGLDLTMLCSYNGVQRSKEQWLSLLEGAGFRVIKIWMPPGVGSAMIEAEVAE